MQHSDYLALMQIETWKLQAKDSPEEQDLSQGYVYSFADKAALLADVNLQSKEEAGLVEKIVAALKVPCKGGFELGFELKQQAGAYPLLVFLGEALAKQYCSEALSKHTCHQIQHQKIILSNSLSDMLADSQLKKQTWADLQLAMREMNVA